MKPTDKSNRPRHRIVIEFVRDIAWTRGVRLAMTVSASDGMGPDIPYEYHADGRLYAGGDVAPRDRGNAARRTLRNLGLRVAS